MAVQEEAATRLNPADWTHLFSPAGYFMSEIHTR